MRHILIAILIVTLIVSIGLFEQIFLVDTMKDMIYTCDSILISLGNGDMDSSRALLEGLTTRLADKRTLLEFFFTHNEFRDMPSLMGELIGIIESGNTKEAIVRTKVVRADAVSHLNILTISLENIL